MTKIALLKVIKTLPKFNKIHHIAVKLLLVSLLPLSVNRNKRNTCNKCIAIKRLNPANSIDVLTQFYAECNPNAPDAVILGFCRFNPLNYSEQNKRRLKHLIPLAWS